MPRRRTPDGVTLRRSRPPSRGRRLATRRVGSTRDARSHHDEAAHQLRPAREYGRRDAGGNAPLPERGHAAAGKLGGARACAGLLLVLRQCLARHLPQRGARSRHQGALPALCVALGDLRILRQSTFGEGHHQRRTDRGPGSGPAQLREIRRGTTGVRRRHWPMPRRSSGTSAPTMHSGTACTSISASPSWSSSAA